MRAKFIYEKFEEDTDPIKDLGIGYVDINVPTEAKYDDLSNSWSYSLGGMNFNVMIHLPDYLQKYDVKYTFIPPDGINFQNMYYYKGYLCFTGLKSNVLKLLRELYDKEYTIDDILNGRHLA